MAGRVGRVTSAHCQRTLPGQVAPGLVCCSWCGDGWKESRGREGGGQFVIAVIFQFISNAQYVIFSVRGLSVITKDISSMGSNLMNMTETEEGMF